MRTYTTNAPSIILEHVAMQSKNGHSKTRKGMVLTPKGLIECKAYVQKNDSCNEVSLLGGQGSFQ